MILTLTVNPAIDQTYTVDRLVFEDRAYIQSEHESAGGRGINASRVIHSFGGQTLAILPSGGKVGANLERVLSHEGFPFQIVRIRKQLRVNLTITDRQGLTVKLNEAGPPLQKNELIQLERAVRRHLPQAQWLMLCGSLPPGVPPEFYVKLIRTAHKQNVQTLLDADNGALLEGIDAHPTIVTPNQQEAERLLNRALITKSQFIEAATRIQAMGAQSVVLSWGSRGAIAVHDGEILEVRPPHIEALCPIGAGDAMAAAIVWARTQGKTFADSVRWGVAAGTASAKLPGVNFASLTQTEEVYAKVEVRPAQ